MPRPVYHVSDRSAYGKGAYGAQAKGALLTGRSPDGEMFRSATGLIETDDFLSIETQGANSVAVYVSDPLALGVEIVFEASIKAGTWFPVSAVNADNDYAGGFRITGLDSSVPGSLPFNGHIEVVAYDKVRVRLADSNSAEVEVVLAAFAGTAVSRSLIYQPRDADDVATPLVVTSKIALTPAAADGQSVDVSSGVVVQSNVSRTGLIMTNVSSAGQVISLGMNASAVLLEGVTLYPGDSFCMGEYDFHTYEISAISSAASGALSIQEFQ